MLKGLSFTLIRNMHLLFARRQLPDRLGVYFHHLELGAYENFKEFVGFFQTLGYSFVSVDSYSENRPKQIFVSFDDNYRSWYRALNLLAELDIKATFYTNSLPFRDVAEKATIEDYYRRLHHDGEKISLSCQEVKEISQAGHTVACHTHSHFDLSKLSFDAAIEEIKINRMLLEEIIGKPIEHFSFPFGMRHNFSVELQAWCLANGFKTVSNAIPGGLYNPFEAGNIYRTAWRLGVPLKLNVAILRVNGRLFERLTGKSPVG